MSHESRALTLERMRADIAEVLDVTPADIGNDDSLTDLGLDSLRVMTLVAQWGDAGADFEFGDFVAATPTLAGWWEVVARHQAERADAP